MALLLSACGSGNVKEKLPDVPNGTEADRILVDKSEHTLVLFTGGKEIARYDGIRFGDASTGHKHYVGDEKTPEGTYTISGRNPKSSYHLSLQISYPNAADRAYAKTHGKSPGGDIFIHGQPNMSPIERLPYNWTDGCIAVSNSEIEQIWKLVTDHTEIEIQP